MSNKLKLSKRFRTVLEDYNRMYPNKNMVEQYKQYDDLLLRDLEVLESALEFYATSENWKHGEAKKVPALEPGYDYSITVPKPLCWRDAGAKAREVLGIE